MSRVIEMRVRKLESVAPARAARTFHMTVENNLDPEARKAEIARFRAKNEVRDDDLLIVLIQFGQRANETATDDSDGFMAAGLMNGFEDVPDVPLE